MPPLLLDKVHQAVSLLPSPMVSDLSTRLAAVNAPYSQPLAAAILQSISNPRLRRSVEDLLAAWRDDQLLNSGSRELAAAITSATYTLEADQKALSVDLVWTGPSPSSLAIRRTDQVLLQLIQDCCHSLTLISFAIYNVPEIVQALIAALDRGVQLRIVAETPESSQGKVAYGLQSTFGPDVLGRAQVFVWPKEKRPVSQDGRHGSLHVKAAIVDDHGLFITSANLTEYALALNMELGVLIRSESLVNQLKTQLEVLIRENVITCLFAGP